MLNLRQIEIFRAFMITGTISGAARILGMSQPAASTALRHLQDRLKIRLFEPVKGRLLVTPEAKALFEEVEAVWGGIERLQERMSMLSQQPSLPLRIVCSPSLGVHHVPAVVTEMLALQPKMEFHIEIHTRDVLVNMLMAGVADIGVAICGIDHPNLVVDRIGSARVVCAMPPGHRLTDLSEISAADLAGVNLIMHSSDIPEGRQIEAALVDAGLERQVKIRVRSGQSACRFVQSGAGLALLDTCSLGTDEFAGVVTRPLVPEIRFEVSMVRNAAHALSRSAELFANRMQRRFATGG